MLTSLILKIFVPGMGENPSASVRMRCGIVSGFAGIISNFFLAAVKFTLAAVSGSIAVAADGVNNLSDASSGIITVVGFRLSNRPPDAIHPFGHGRIEYVAGLVVALIIVGLGISLLKDSVISIFRPQKVAADTVTLIIFSATILVKCWLFFFHRKIGKMIHSDVVKAAAWDSLSDCLGTCIVVAALFTSRYTDFPLDGCAGVIVAGMILWGGGNVLKDTVSKLLGEPPDKELVEKLRELLLASPGIDGVHDIMIHNYGEGSYYVTAHAEISGEGDRFSAHDILENAEVAVRKKLPVHLLLHGDPYSKEDPEVIYWRSRMENEVSMFDSEFKLYDFRLVRDDAGTVQKLSFHLLIPHQYAIEEAEIHEDLSRRMAKYNASLGLNITFLKSFI